MYGGSCPGGEPVRAHLTNLLSGQWPVQAVVGPGSPGEWGSSALRMGASWEVTEGATATLKIGGVWDERDRFLAVSVDPVDGLSLTPFKGYPIGRFPSYG